MAMITLEEFMKDFTPEEKAQVAGRTAQLVNEALTLRNRRQTPHTSDGAWWKQRGL